MDGKSLPGLREDTQNLKKQKWYAPQQNVSGQIQIKYLQDNPGHILGECGVQDREDWAGLNSVNISK